MRKAQRNLTDHVRRSCRLRDTSTSLHHLMRFCHLEVHTDHNLQSHCLVRSDRSGSMGSGWLSNIQRGGLTSLESICATWACKSSSGYANCMSYTCIRMTTKFSDPSPIIFFLFVSYHDQSLHINAALKLLNDLRACKSVVHRYRSKGGEAETTEFRVRRHSHAGGVHNEQVSLLLPITFVLHFFD